MGMEHVVTFPGSAAPAWGEVAALLASRGFPVEVRMMDGNFVDADEAVPESWRELRLGTAQGMVTVRRGGDGWHAVTWGNADARLRQAWNALAWAAAAAGGGRVGELSAEEFRRQAEMPPALAAGPG